MALVSEHAKIRTHVPNENQGTIWELKNERPPKLGNASLVFFRVFTRVKAQLLFLFYFFRNRSNLLHFLLLCLKMVRSFSLDRPANDGLPKQRQEQRKKEKVRHADDR